ncbi:hypothetical protein DFR86_11425 [Acidianus sulfidivorans JP7]|uniref:CRISPR type III-associated protein domain-containing protein n=1 Tax=Acidianus sulfidivorans JP7 TaxID=619593 RepID=A0A2U9IPZ3_9CREN|nr:RAMP superfamily CRISPR-associated protein [Acidianus sulfidivorans]AWR98085.1 hypothetical protein DFR86_11425 [Acidianus sulfidivorans JP7]
MTRVTYTNTLKVNNLRGHIESGKSFVDLSAMYIPYCNDEGTKIYVISGSSLKGIIRRNVKILQCDSSFLGSEFNPNKKSGTSPDNQSKMSKVIIGWGYIRDEIEKLEKKVRYGIMIDKYLGIVKERALYSYEILPGSLKINFDIVELSSLTENEKSCLAKAILLMKYSTIGWGGSKGIGIVEEVILDDRLQSVLGKK